MSLIRIELQGFKSFPNRTVINIDNGFTGIVGPNGCGKSNISDAIRWVLGEQSAKRIRGGTMKDVIFSGTEKLNEMGYAEVTLVFDNTKGEFAYKGDEFSITRKIFRSKGDNFYYLNNKQCRRSEIVELFRDTGVGKDGFSIVSQGKISEIINFKSSDRRKIFDEAAGVALVKTMKKKTVDMLEDTQQKMDVVQAGVTMLEEDLKVLEKEVEAAKQYKILSNDIMVEELNYFVHIYESAESEKEKIRVSISEESEYIAKQEESLANIRRKITSLDEEFKNADDEVLRKLNLREHLNLENERSNSKLNMHNQQIEMKKDTLSKLEKDKKECEISCSKAKASLEELEAGLSAKKEQKTEGDIQYSVISANCEALSNQIADAEKRIEQLNLMQLSGADKLGEMLSAQGSASGEADVLRENLADCEKSVQEARLAMQSAGAVVDDLDKRIAENTESNDNALAKRSSTAMTINEIISTRANLGKKLNETGEIVARKRMDTENLLRRIKEERGYNRVTRSVLERAASDSVFGSYVKGAVGDLYTVDADYADAIFAALGGSVNNVVTANTYDTHKVLDFVKTLHQGRLICLPITEIRGESLSYEYRGVLKDSAVVGIASELISYKPEFEPIYKRLLGRIVIVTDYVNADRLWRLYDHGFKIVTLAGEYFDTSGSISAGDNKTDSDKKYAEAKKSLAQLTAQFDADKATYERLEKKQEDTRAELENIRSLLEDIREARAKLETEKRLSQQAYEEAIERLKKAESIKSVTNARLEKVLSNLERAKSEGGKVADSRTSIDELIAEAKGEKEESQKQFDEANTKREALLVEVNKLEEAISALEKEIQRLRNEITNKTSLFESLELNVKQLNSEIEMLLESKPKIELSDEQQKRINAITDEVTELNKRKSEISEIKARLESEREEVNQRYVLSNNKRASLNTKLEGVDSELDEWKEKVFNAYEADYTVALSFKKEGFDAAHAKTRIAKLSAARTRLGSVNLGAEETYVRKKADYDQRFASLSDMVEAKQNLINLIERYASEIDTKFLAAFEVIKENFQRSFSDLFGGGKAELFLRENPDDPDEDGVDIEVTVPGKSRKNLSLLSGGEQTLTAIAILFAILRYKSSPFVILDEVESALDETNCEKFAKYLKAYSLISKFIVITHKKPTMAQADVLYGVTMMRPGVSNIVSVSMTEAVKLSEDDK